jgi:hypothetical protein
MMNQKLNFYVVINLPSRAKILYNLKMAQQNLAEQNKRALTAAILAQFRKPHELTKITLLLLALAHTKMRPGFTLHEPQQEKRPNVNQQKNIKSKKGFSIKQPRSRFL